MVAFLALEHGISDVPSVRSAFGTFLRIGAALLPYMSAFAAVLCIIADDSFVVGPGLFHPEHIGAVRASADAVPFHCYLGQILGRYGFINLLWKVAGHMHCGIICFAGHRHGD